jgi:HEAT repeats
LDGKKNQWGQAMNLAHRSSSLGLALVAALALAACAPTQYLAKAPEPSGMKYVVTGAPAMAAQISIIDARVTDDRVFSSGVLPATLAIDGIELEPIGFLAKHLSGELASRGLPTSAVVANNDVPRLKVNTFRMLNHRVSAFSPFVTLTFLSADVEAKSGIKRLGVFIKRGKVPVWSFDEVLDPIFNQPLSLVIRELASKIANTMYGYSANPDEVAALLAKVAGPRSDGSFLDVYSLGFSNNRAALPTLVELTKDADEYVRLAAISSLGTMRAVEQLPMLKSIYETATFNWQDRAMAIKSIGDLDTPDSKAYLQAELKRLGSSAAVDNDTRWTTQLIALYVQ